MTDREHTAEIYRGDDGGRIACACGEWRSEPGDTLSNQRAAHRRHRVDMGETASPLGSTQERLAAAEAAIARAKEITNAMLDAVSPYEPETRYGYRILAALDGETPKDQTTDLTCGDCGQPVTHANYRCGIEGCPNSSVDLAITAITAPSGVLADNTNQET